MTTRVLLLVLATFLLKPLPCLSVQAGIVRKEAAPPTQSPPPAPNDGTAINIDFGGAEQGVDMKGDLVRPALVKSIACTDSVCQDCVDHENCWHGRSYAKGDGYNVLFVDVPKNSGFTKYVAEVWARCPSTNGGWAFTVEDIVNGQLSFFTDGALVQEVSEQERLPKTIDLNIAGDTKARLRASFSPTNAAKFAWAEVALDANGVDKSVDDCMTVKDCMSLLVDGDDGGFELRNGNVLQLHCLEGETSALSSLLNTKCAVWLSCMDTAKKTALKTFLRVALGTAALIEERPLQLHGQAVDPNTCINPETDDPESWECDCFANMQEACKDSDDEEACFLGLFCSRTSICQSWKDLHCPAHLLESKEEIVSSSLVAAVANRSAKARDQAALGNSLDGSMQGKCVM